MIPLIVAASSVPAFLAGAAGLAWAGGDPNRTLAVAVGLAVAVNGLGLFVLWDVMRRRRGTGGR